MLDIWEYIRPRNPASADQLVRTIDECCHTLGEYPHMGRLRIDLGGNIRSFPVKEYVIFYKAENDGILVLRVLHAARHLSALL